MSKAISEFFSLALHCVGKKAGRDSDEIFVYYVGTGFGKPWHFAEGYDLFCLTVETTCFT